MAETYLTSNLAQGLLDHVLSLASEPIIRAWRLKDDLDDLKDRMTWVRTLLSYAETKEMAMAEPVLLWLNKLRNVARDADALLDELAYEVAQKKVEPRKALALRYLPRLKTSRKIQDLNQSLDRIYKEGEKIGLRPLEHISSITARGNRPIRQTSPNVDDTQIMGRKNDESKVVQMLCGSNEEERLSVIAIEGMGGLGKTTLAQLVYKNDRVSNYFGKKMWVTVYEDFDAARILNEMVQSVSHTNPQLSNLEALTGRLKKELDGKKFLLVLDDVWNEDSGKWQDIQVCLRGITSSIIGNKILITTRGHQVSQIMHGSPYKLGTLSKEDSWLLFKRRAFAHGGARETEHLQAIGKRMVQKCGGLPLAIKALAGSLYYKNTEHDWLKIEGSPHWNCDEVLPSLRISFDHLQSSSLKHCFAYCSIFPKDCHIKKNCLIQQWMALGLLHHPERGDLEDVGEEYFRILIWNSLLQDVKEFNNIVCYKMHDLVHDLALYVSKNCRSTLQTTESNDIPEDSLYLNLVGASEEKLRKFEKGSFHRLQVLFFDENFCAAKLKELEDLRILVLEGREIKELPSVTGKLKHLRYLDISNTDVSKLPDSITKVFLLQTLRVHHLEELPKRFANLINLKHFCFLREEGSENCSFVGIKQLTSLKTLPFFVVNRANGCLLNELGGLDNLTSTLKIYGLRDVGDTEEARDAKLNKKLNIKALVFHWADVSTANTDSLNDEGVLEGLKPHPNLKRLEIENFMGKSFASWMMVDRSFFKLHYLEVIVLKGCKNCERLPALGHLPRLKVVVISRVSNLKCIDTGFYGRPIKNENKFDDGSSSSSSISSLGDPAAGVFPALRFLKLEYMEELEEWWDHPSPSSSPSYPTETFPCLERLLIFGCPKLRVIPGHFSSLKDLQICRIDDIAALEKMSRSVTSLDKLRLFKVGGSKIQILLENLLGNNTSLQNISLESVNHLTEISFDSLQLCTSLKTLVIRDCPTLVSVPDMRHLTTLQQIGIGGFWEELEYFPWPYPYSSLRIVRLRGWPKLKSLPDQLQYLSSMTNLSISSFDGLETLPDWIGSLSNLSFLELFNCKNLMHMPGEEAMQSLLKLERLLINKCPLLEKRCAKGSGPEWYKIAHVPSVDINWKNVQFSYRKQK